MVVAVDGRKVNSGRPIDVGVVRDNAVVTLEFEGLPELSDGQVVTLYWEVNDGEYSDGVVITRNSDGRYEFTVTSDMTNHEYDRAIAYINVASSTQNWNSRDFTMLLHPLHDIVSEVPAPESTQIEQLTAAAAACQEAASGANSAASAANDAASAANTATGAANMATASANRASAAASNSFASVIAERFDEGKAYAKDDFVLQTLATPNPGGGYSYSDKLYWLTAKHTAGASEITAEEVKVCDVLNRLFNVEKPKAISGGTNLNSVTTPGTHCCNSASVYANLINAPFFVGSGFLMHVYNSRPDENPSYYKRQVIFANKTGMPSIYTRQRNTGAYSDWRLLIDSGMYESPLLLADSDFAPAARIQGTPLKTIRVGTNNVAHYWLQSTNERDYLDAYPKRIATWRRWLMKADLDILFLQECEDYIDQARSKSAFGYLYAPFFDEDTNEDESGGTDITTKYRRKILNRLGLDTNSNMETVVSQTTPPNERDGYFNWSLVNITSVGSVLLVCLHNFANGGKEADRATYLSALASFIATKDPDYFIIAGDTNVMSSTDRENLLSFCETVGGTPVNGGILGWFATDQIEESGKSYDNIIVSNNIRIDSVECDPVLVPGKFIHTDHTPVTSTITFMDVSE